MTDIKRPDTFTGCDPGDEVLVEAVPGYPRRCWHRPADGELHDISHCVDGVEPTADGFRIGGQKKKPGHFSITDRWSADVVTDGESSETHMRGVVR